MNGLGGSAGNASRGAEGASAQVCVRYQPYADVYDTAKMGDYYVSTSFLLFGLVWTAAAGSARVADVRLVALTGYSGPNSLALNSLAQLVLGVWLALILALPDSLAAVHYAGVSADFLRGPAWWPLPPALLLVVLLLGFFLQGGMEEWIIRGYIYHTLRERWRPWMRCGPRSTGSGSWPSTC